MVKVYASAVIPAPAERVWQVFRDFNGLPNWHPAIAQSRIEEAAPADKIGCVRNFQTQDGGTIRERLLSLSDYDYALSYAILESPMGVRNYTASMRVFPVTDAGHAFAEWSAEFDCDAGREQELMDFVGKGVFQGGLTALKERFARG